MDAERYALLSRILAGALDRDGSERARFLDEQCGPDESLRLELQGLLALANDDDTRDLFAEREIAAARKALAGIADQQADSVPWLPERIGDYRILGRLGLGGMGVVYEAVQETLGRRVAVKLLHPLHATPDRLRRFRQEAALLARLQHPNIAQIHEAGVYDSDRGSQPFFAMELVEGSDLRTYCERERLDVRDRLALLAQVADGVQYAHDHGVIHRDLKPENVLVDGNGQPKVLDFGVARASRTSSVLSTIVTEEGQLLGTLSYMAPEQLRASPEQTTARVDVYALGALGFEILTGRLPHLVADLPISAAIALLANTDAPRAGSVDARLTGDVETILGKALETEPGRRYPSAAALADDIRRHLDNLPVRARPPTRLYRLQKFARRHRGLTIGASATLLTLLSGLAIALVLVSREHRQHERADQNALQLRRSEARVVSALMASAKTLLSQEHPFEALAQHRLVPESSRGWGWRLLARSLPDVIDVPSGIPDVQFPEAPGREPPRWRFLDDDRILALDRQRECILVRSLIRPGEERERFRGLGLERIGEATPTGFVLGFSGGDSLLLDLNREVVLDRFPAQLTWTLGNASDDGSVVVVQTSKDQAQVWKHGQLSRVFDCSGPSGFARSDCRIAPDGRTVFVNRLVELAIVDLETGAERRYPPGDEFDRILGLPLEQGWLCYQWGDSKALARTATSRQRGFDDPPLAVPTAAPGGGRRPLFPRDGRFVSLEAGGGRVLLRDTDTGLPVRLSPYQDAAGRFDSESAFQTLAEVSPGGRRLLCLSLDRAPWLIDLDPRRLDDSFDPRCSTYREHQHYLYHLAVSHDGSLIASASASEPLVRVFDARTLETVATLKRRCDEFASRDALMAFSADDDRLVITTPMAGKAGAGVVDWNLVGGSLSEVWPDEAVTRGNHAPLLDRFIERLDPGPRDRLGQKAQMAGRRALAVDRGYEDGFHWMGVQPDSGGRRWSSVPETGHDPKSDTLALAVHPTRDEVAIVVADRAGPGALSASGTLEIRSPEDGGLLESVRLQRQPWSVAYSPDGQVLAIGCNDGHVLVIETEFLTVRSDFQAHQSYVYSLAWMEDGDRLVTLSGDTTVRIWDARPLTIRDAELERWRALRARAADRSDLDTAWKRTEGLERAALRIERIRSRPDLTDR